ncbi:tetratricopeptide-like helical domain-containing protein [Artemisia annua]|uniref:Tetratricopeptide-like helical domain-containing protein n=1 Tax=Artemisia annua TaxID=35608 RepID=A0A2U1LHB6_ARTAN|nr:tetratricopeptide-like helical domain-containing protein [Artemisia annua]
MDDIDVDPGTFGIAGTPIASITSEESSKAADEHEANTGKIAPSLVIPAWLPEIELFSEMQAKGLTPSTCTYGILLHGMCKSSKCSDALVLFRSPKCGKLNMVVDLFAALLLKGLKANVRTYTVMIQLHFQEDSFKLKKNECREAKIILEEMTNQAVIRRIHSIGEQNLLSPLLMIVIPLEEE